MTKPLWEAWLVEGLADDRWAIISKVHHCMIDGVAGTDLMQLIFDLEPDPVRPEPVRLDALGGPVHARADGGVAGRDACRSRCGPSASRASPTWPSSPWRSPASAVAAKELVPQQIAQLVPGRGQPTPRA